MKKSVWVASSIIAASYAVPVFACSGVPCLPTNCLVEYYAHVNGAKSVPAPLPTGLRPSGGSISSEPISKNMTLLSQVTLAQMGGTASDNGSSLYGWVDPLTSKEYAIMGREQGTSFIDITNPTAPVVVANLPRVAGTSATSWREPKVFGNTVYIGVDGTSVGMQIMDLTKLRTASGNQALTADAVYSGVTKIHTMAINKDTGYLYLAGTNQNGGGLRVLNLNTNPLAPTAVGNTTLDGYTHEAQVVTYKGPDSTYFNKEIAFNSNGPNGVLSILDVSNKAAITRISARTYAGEAYIHQGWLTEDQRYFFQNDELDEPGTTSSRTKTHLWDVSDLDNPVYKGFFQNTTTSIDHNLYVKGGYVYETNYTTGLRVLKIGDLTSSDSSQWLTEVAYYDTYALNDNGGTSTGFHGAWNNYPYFPSGNIAISDIDGGLFIVKADLPKDPRQIGLLDGIPAVPEPSSLALVSIGAAMALRRRRTR